MRGQTNLTFWLGIGLVSGMALGLGSQARAAAALTFEVALPLPGIEVAPALKTVTPSKAALDSVQVPVLSRLVAADVARSSAGADAVKLGDAGSPFTLSIPAQSLTTVPLTRTTDCNLQIGSQQPDTLGQYDLSHTARLSLGESEMSQFLNFELPGPKGKGLLDDLTAPELDPASELALQAAAVPGGPMSVQEYMALTPVPEPSSLSLLLLGAGSCLLAWRKRLMKL